MKKGRTWSRIVAIVLASVMLLTDQSVTLAADVIADTQTQDSAGTGSGAANTDPAASGEQSSPDVTYSEEENGATQQTGQTPAQTQSQPQQSAPAQTQSQPQQSTPAQTQSQPQQSAPAQTQPAGPQELTLTDEETGVRVIGMNNVLPEGAALRVDEKKEEEDTDYPAQAKEDIATKLEQEENLSLTDIAFYDINLGGGQPSDKIEVRFSVPDDWTGELDAWYIDDQGKVTNMDGEKNETEKYFAFQTDHFSLYALSVSGPKEEDNTIEETQPAQQQKAPRIGDDGNAAFTSVEQMAEAYYGENATNPQTAGSVTISSSHAGNTVMAGDELSFTLTYTMNPAPLYNYGEQTKTLFDSYNDTKIRFRLPEGMTLIGEDDIDGATASYDKGTREWIFTLDNTSIDAGASSTGSFSIRVQVEGNGALEIGKTFDFDIQENLSMTTKFTVYDKTDSANPVKIKDYSQTNQTITPSLPTLTSTSQDKWGLAKSHVSNTVAKDKSTVTVRWELAFGLQTSEGGMVTNQASYYQAHGRAPFNGDGKITLNEALAVAGNQDLTPNSITVTEQFGDKKGYEVTNGTVEVATDTCGNHNVSGIDKGAPYYSEYFVDVVYDYEEFIAKYSDPDQDKLTVENTAQATYQLKGATDPVTVEDTADTQIGEVTQPAELIIEKYIEDYDGNGTRLYKAGDTWDPVSGPAEFTVTTKDGAEAVLYTKNADGAYTKLEGNTVSIDPATAGEDGKVTVYLDAGEYEITETKKPEHTQLQTDPQSVNIEEGKSQTVKVTNKELLGGVLIHKEGHINSEYRNLAGAEFGIYSDTACEDLVARGKTNASGNLQFDRLVPGTYYVKEIEAPEGYLPDTEVYTVEVRANEVNDKLDWIVNEYNLAHLKLQKMYRWFSTGALNNVDSTNYQEFAGCFTLQQSIDGGKTWTAVEGVENVGLIQQGNLFETDFPVYHVAEDGTRTPIQYRFREVLPENWHGDGEIEEAGSRVLYSEVVTLENVIGNSSADAKIVEMVNSRNGDLELTKKYVTVNDTGKQITTTAKENEATFDLYRQVGENGAYEHVGTYQTDASGKIQATDLPGEKGGEIINYYWVEVNAGKGDYALECSGQKGNNAKVTTITVNGDSKEAVGPFYFRPKSTGETISISQDITVQNVEQKVPVRIKKIDTLTNKWMDGAKITISRVEAGGEKTVVYDNVAIPSAGYLAILEAGHEYIVEETTVPSHYTCVSTEEELTIDLTEAKVSGSGISEIAGPTVKNQPDPSITIEKKLMKADDSTSDLDGTQFEVYTKEGDTFTPVTENGKTLILEAGSSVYLEKAGTYYLHEVVTDDMKVLSPDTYPELYKDDYPHVISGDKFFFGPYEVKDEEKTQDLGEITNISSLGGLTVTKSDKEGNQLDGAEIQVYYKDGNEEKVVGTGTTPDNGQLTFKDLPIYDADGKEITYYIRETKAPGGYYGTTTELSTTLIPGDIVSTVNGQKDGDKLTLVNNRYQTFTVSKVYYNVWEHAFTGEEIPLEGTTIALYKKNADNTYEWVKNGKTDSLGQVTFEELTDEAGDEYVAVEVDIPQTAKDEYVYPEGNKAYLPDPTIHTELKTLTKDQLDTYNWVSPDENNQGKLTNEIGWTQLRIDKFMMRRADEKDENSPETRKVAANYCQFQLYQQIVPEDAGTELTFDADKCTLIGEYSSGTFIGTDGEPEDGKFATDILDVADNIVYWLVETQAGPGAKIMPEQQYILFTRKEGHIEYTNNTGESTRVEKYPDNAYSWDRIENEAVYGEGQDYYASVRLQKWAGSYTENGEKIKDSYEPLGNASYELWVVNESGDLLEKVDDITVGLESDPNAPDGELSAMGMSKALWYNNTDEDKGFEKYNAQEAEGNEDDITWKDAEHNCFYVRMALRESYVPYGYQIDAAPHYMIVRFTPTGEGMTYNDAYFVKNKEQQVPLADEQTEIVWPGRFTIDGETTEYGAENENLYRLVNWPLTNFSVTVQKYGYQPGVDAPLNRTAEQLDAWFEDGHTGRVPLEGVTMKLQRYDGGEGGTNTWRDYDYQDETWGTRNFTTNAAGTFTFPKGLDIGQYRIVETAMPAGSDYEILYDGKTVSGGTGETASAYRYFRVSSESLVISMYNPEKISLSIQKKDTGNNPAEAAFTLTIPGVEKAAYTAQTIIGGTAVFAHINSGTYYLGETSGDMDTSYFTKYIKENYPGLADFVDPAKGITFGYTKAANTALGDVVVSGVQNLDDEKYGLKGQILTIQNPDLVSLEIGKVDAETDDPLDGAEFEVYYQAFDSFSGTHAVKDMTVAGNRTLVGTYTTEDGKISLTGLKPGVYYVVETKAPGGYELAEDPDQIIALTGGMNVTVTGVETCDGDGDAQLTFENRKLASIQVTKKVEEGAFTEGPDSYSALFQLYDSVDSTEPLQTDTATKTEQAEFTGLKQGTTYYLAEQASDEYVLKSVEVDDEEIQPQNGRYAITPTTGQSAVKVEVTNTWLYAQVTVLKVDGNTGIGLTGAEFVLEEPVSGADGQQTWQAVPEERVTRTKGEDGAYTVKVRLEGKDAAQFRIRELLAPEGYLVDQTPIKVTLEPGTVLTYEEDGWQVGDTDEELREKLIVPNYNGVTIQIHKYGNMHGADVKSDQNGVTFRMYTYDDITQEWRLMDSQKTEGNGIATFTVAAGYEYAISEESVPSGYAGLEGVWTSDGIEIKDTATVDEGGANPQTLYILDTKDLLAGQTYTYNAYNIPLVDLEVQKKDAGGNTTLVPRADISVYEVPAGTKTELTEEEVDDLKVPTNLVGTGNTSKTGEGYSYKDDITVVPGKTYLVVEDKVTGTSGYETMILDDKRVVWYKVITIPEGTTEKQTVTLENVLGTADVKIDKKSASQTSSASLFEQGSEITYTLTPQVENSYALDGFTLTDTGLTAYHGAGSTPAELDFDTYLKDQYTISQVRLGQASHETGNYKAADGHPEAGVISAKVTFIDFEGGEHATEPVTVSTGEQVVMAPATEGVKYAQVKVEYYSDGLKQLTGYQLGQNFKPGTVQVTAELDQQQGGEDRQSVDRVVNTAEAEIAYTPWSSTGEKEAQVTKKAQDTAVNSFGQQEVPMVTVTKAADDATVNLNNGTVNYTLTLENISENGEAMINPILIDLLPEGVIVDPDTAYFEITGNNPSNLSVRQDTVVPVAETNAIVLNFSGNLEAGDSLQVVIHATVTNAAASYGTSLPNYVFATSDEPGIESDENPNAASFKDSNGVWAGELTTVATSLQVDGGKASALKDALGSEGTGAVGNYGFIGALADIRWFSSSAMTLVKENKGDQDSSYSSSRLAQATNGGTIDYRLTMNNTSSTDNRLNLTVMDLLPQEGDLVSGGTERYSVWPAYLTGYIKVTLGENTLTPDQYKIYYYTGEIPAANSPNYSRFFGAVQGAQDGCPDGWTETRPADTAIKAFIVAVNEAQILETTESLVVEYQTKVTDEEGNHYTAEEMEKISYLNAVNNFQCYYDSYPTTGSKDEATSADQPLESNSVSATIVPNPVKVGGHVWIDADGNGRKDGKTIEDYSRYKIVQDMLDKIEIRLYTYRNKKPGMNTTAYGEAFQYNQKNDEDWYTDANYVFDNLGAGFMTVDEGKAYSNRELQVQHLKGDEPRTYIISATLPDTIIGKFGLTQMLGSKKSQKPGSIPDTEQNDSNFTYYEDTQRNLSERFYLWDTDITQPGNWDNTKDVGLVLYRDLEITKQSELPAKDPVDGAVFKIYGPFDDDEGSTANLAEAPVVGTYETKDGKISVPNLNWFQEYVIVEEKAAPGYELDGAEAAGSENIEKLGERKWLLKVPDTESMVRTENVTITNVRKTEVELEATKTLKGKELLAGQFQFELLADDGTTVLQKEVSNDAEGKVTFAPVTIQGEGTHTFYIKETIPEEAIENEDTSKGITYDDTIYRVVVTTEWDDTDHQLEVTGIQYFADNAQTPSQDGAAFENTYDASGSWTPEGTKTLTGRDMEAGETYNFIVKEGEETVGTGTATGPATAGKPADITFTDIQYTLEDVGVHTYTITEDKGGTTVNGVEFTDKSFTITVDVKDAGDGTLTATPTYPEGGVAFVNDYKPTPISYAPAVEKTLTGHKLPDGEGKDFTFTLTPDKDNPDGATLPQETTLTIPISGKTSDAAVTATKAFGEITFSKAGTYMFTIKETAGTESYYSYDTAEWTLTVVVNDDGRGHLSRVVSYKSSVEGTTANNGAAKFSNEYHPNPATATLTVSKTVEGQELPDDPDYKTFTFTMSMSEDTVPGVTMPENKTATVTVTETGEAETADFDEITFTKAGTYVFRITEDTENLPEGYDKDRVEERRARVVVVDDNGSLKVDSITYYLTTPDDPDDTQNASDFTNYYDTAHTGFAPKVSKTLTGDTPPGEKEFTFKLKADENNPEGATLPDPAQTSVIYEKRIGGASASFNAITFEKAGTFTFTITEVSGKEGDGYTYDTAQWTLTVTVKDEGGKLKVESYSYAKDGETITGAEAAAFENSYKVTPTEYTPGVTKAMTGADRQKAQTYEFTLTPGEKNPEGGATVDDTEASITVPKDKAVNTEVSPTDDGFGKITFKKAGTYTFTIQEEIPEKAAANGNTLNGVTYDDSKWTLTVVVEDEGSLLKVTSHTYAKTGGSSNNDAAKFVNDYEVTPTEFTPDVRKTVTGEIRPAEETFIFTFTADKDNPEDGATFTDGQATVTVPEGGTDEGSLVAPATDPFGKITFTKAGTYKFQITEVEGNADGYSYDTDPWTLTVVVNDENGQLVVDQAQTKYERTGETELTDYALFTNHYEVDSIGYAPQVKKTVDGNVPAGRDAQFQFELKLTKADPADGLKLKGENGAVMTDQDVLKTEVTGEATGTFDEITFTRAGTYTFQITEVKGDTAGYSYDGHIWTLEVKVKDEGGKLTIESETYSQTEAGEPTGVTSKDQAEFTNTYDPKETSYTPQIRKEITGDQRSEDQVFDFTLTPDDQNPAGASLAVPDMDKASVTGEDIARFSTITFTEAGTYHFTIGEERGTEPGYTYDDSEWDLEIVVEDQGGFLTVTENTYSRTDADGQEVTSDEEATFTNDYEVVPIGYTPTVTKAVTGDVPEGRDAKFRFALTAREDNPEGAVLPTDTEVTIEGSGEADFGEIVFEQAGTYRFDITEINDKLTGYQYDGSVWTLTVVVKDTEHILGVESAVYTRQDEATSDVAAFENHYQPNEAAYAPRVTKHLSGDKTPSNATFTFTMQALADNPEGAAVEGTSASVAGAGQTAFAPITFTKAGTYRFDIREADGHEAGYTYDEHIWRVTVEVADEDGVLTIAEVTYEKLGTFMSNGEAAEFTNEYDEAVTTGGRVKTGDPADFSWPLAGVSISALFILILLSWRRKEKASTK